MEFWVTLGDIKAKIDVSMNHPDREHQTKLYGPGHMLFASYYPGEDAFIDESTYQTTEEMKLSQKMTSYHEEGDNLKRAMTYFNNLMEGKIMTNMGMATFITQVLEDL